APVPSEERGGSGWMRDRASPLPPTPPPFTGEAAREAARVGARRHVRACRTLGDGTRWFTHTSGSSLMRRRAPTLALPRSASLRRGGDARIWVGADDL